MEKDETNYHLLIEALLAGWEGARDESDSMQAVLREEIPDWENKVKAKIADVDRIAYTRERFQIVRSVFSALVSGEPESHSLLLQAVEALTRKPN